MKTPRKRKNILEGMQTEQQRLADEAAFLEHFDYLESKQKTGKEK